MIFSLGVTIGFACSIGATIGFACSIVAARHASRAFGALAANFLRLALATALLALYAHTVGSGLEGSSRWYFLLSGVIGFGLGDVALFLAVSRIGPRLTVLLTQTLAAPFAALIEQFWLGTSLTGSQLFFGAVILGGTALAVAPQKGQAKLESKANRVQRFGILCGVFAAIGQGGGAVVSRKAFQMAQTANFPIDGITAAYQRILGGVVIAGLFWVVVALARGRTALQIARLPASGTAREYRWVVANALCGPVIGVSLFQWALKTTPSGIVLPIVATTPIVAMPLAFWLDGDRPSPSSILGAVIAVSGVIALILL
jgi:drug/metabolite transporter (DMT)-like permease